MVIVTPIILENNLLDFDEKLIKASQLCSRIQIDVLDGKFIDNSTLMPDQWPVLPSNLTYDIHLMVVEPELWVGKFRQPEVKLIIGQYEAINDIDSFFINTKSIFKKIGLAIDIETPIDVLRNIDIDELSAVVVMCIKLGYAGQEFDNRALPKIKALRQILGNSAEIIVDGGIDEKTGMLCLEAGADVLSANSFLWEDPEKNLRKLQGLKPA